MGVAAAVLGVLAALGGAALLTRLLEPMLLRASAEAGPAAQAAGAQVQHADHWVYAAAPLVALAGVALAMLVIPFGPRLIGADLGIGVFYLLVVVDFVALGLALGGWGAGSEEAIDVYYRATAQLVAYVVPIGLAYVGAIMMARSLSTLDIVARQEGLWYIVTQPIGFALYVVSGLMQCYRPPFSEPFSPHIGGGVLAVFAGWKALALRLALDGVLFVVAAMGAVLYLGGWHGPLLPGPVWMLVKTYALMALMLWVGTRFRPLSSARMLELSWKVLTPIGMLNVLVVGVLILLGVGSR
jgi:NADH-quinone oxidoreductase subunit H